MTSKLDTARLVERFLIWANEIDIDGTPSQVGPTSDDLRQWAEALTQAAAPDMEPVAWLGTNLDGESEAFLSEHQAAFWSNGACNTEPLVLRSAAVAQLYALQERVERAERERDELLYLQSEVEAGDRIMQQRLEAAEARVAELEKERDKAWRVATDHRYMKEAYWYMLGPVGLKVADMWFKKGVLRVHHSWGPEAAALTGEERAQFILDWEEASKTAVPVESIDGDGPPSAALRQQDGGKDA